MKDGLAMENQNKMKKILGSFAKTFGKMQAIIDSLVKLKWMKHHTGI